ncbi:MAG: hypothetical protein KBC96_12140 [Armatimonadetes bacterium]|nr:hypothetical protein [Armatimonadota bacterium]
MFEFSALGWPAVTLAAAVVGTWLAARAVRVASLRRIARTRLRDSSPDARRFVKRLGKAELAAYGSVTLAEFLWVWHNINPDLIQAADFASAESITSGWDFANYIHGAYDSLPAAGKEGFLSRLEGYVAEQHVAAAFDKAGYAVQVAETSNQPVWDLLVDGHAVNVKSVADIGSIKQAALDHPDITYIVPEHIHATAELPNVFPMPGFDHDAIKESVKDGVSSAHGEGAADALGVHLPVITIAFATYRNYKLVKDYGKEPMVARGHGIVESVGRGVGVVAGGKVGAAAGFAVGGPVGAVLGAIGLGIAGAIAGGGVAEWFKSRELRASLAELESALYDFGASFRSKMPAIRSLISARLARAEESRCGLARELRRRWFNLRTLLWPDLCTVTLGESVAVADGSIARAREQTSKALARLGDIERTGDWKSLGLIMANAPEVRNRVGFDRGLLDRIKAFRAKILRERKRLNPKLDLPG